MALACSKHGSRSLDAMWLKASAKGREWIAAELAEKESGTNCIEIALPGKLILSKRKGLREVLFS